MKGWNDALFTNKDGSHIIEGWCSKDGLLVRINSNDALFFLKRFPKKRTNSKEWYFNNTYDRVIAEYVGFGVNMIEANPQLIWQNGYEIIT